MSDGSRLRQAWYSALSDAEAYFRQLLTSSSAEWKRISTSVDNTSAKKGKPRAVAVPELSDVIVHRNTTKGGEDVYRLMLDVPVVEEQVSLEPWKAVLTTPELRQDWDPAVEDAHLLEIFDHSTRISKTNFSLGWPANPRDAVTISRSFNDPTTVIDISTSLPRSPDEPAYLRPSPPFVRSHVYLFAWCVQHIQAQQPQADEPNKKATPGKLRITCFWQHDLKEMWGFGSSSASLAQQLSTMVLSLLKTVLKRGGRVPKLIGYGNDVSIERVRFQMDREALTIDYSIIPEDNSHTSPELMHGMDDVHIIREQKRLTRSIECVLPSLEGWEVQVSLKASSEEVERLPWSANAIKTNSNPSIIAPPDQILLRLTHSALLDEDSVLKVKVVIEASGGTRGLRLNGLPKKIHDTEQRDPTSYIIPQKILQDIATADLSIQTSSSSFGTVASSISGSSSVQTVGQPQTERTAAAEKSILSRVRRNYIYFSSLLQEPEAKWRRTTDARGVSITQLDSIDPTLVVYRAEATFVGVGLWDLYGAVVSPGARVYWDKQHEDSVLLEDVNELTELWHFKSKPAWPVNGRDSVVLKTVYKSPTTIHVFSFSADDPHLFSNIPPVEPNTIRTQVDLQGWSIEALSPTTTLLTLLEQSDPKGWTNKTSIPTQMINTLAGIGEFAIKCGGPPILTRLTGAKANQMRYDHEKGSFRVEYEASASRRSTPSSSDCQDDTNHPSIECEIRCDVDTWASSLDIVVDPPPQTMSCLRRHRLSAEGGGLWLTLTHDCVFVDDERLLVLVRRAPGKEKGLVMVNGAKVQVDVEEIPEHELKALSKQKRVKPPRIPLDQPPVMGAIRKRRAEWNDESTGGSTDTSQGAPSNSLSAWASAPRISSPLSRFLSYAMDQATTTTQQAVAAITPANGVGSSVLPSATKLPMQHALEALAWTQEAHRSTTFSSSSASDGWTLVSDKGMTVHRKLIPEISPIIPVHKGHKVIEGVSGEELALVIMEDECRRVWDDRFDSARTLEAYGSSCRTWFHTAKGGFPFRDRGFYLASVAARTQTPSSSTILGSSSALSRRDTSDTVDQSGGTKNAIFVVTASFSADSVTPLFAAAKYNSYVLPIGRVYLDAWVLETLDPYSKENYAIPSTRCTRLVAVDYAGSIPAAVNSMINAALPRAILAVETYMKTISSLPMTRLPTRCLVLAEKKGEDRLATVSWKLRKRDENRVLVDESFVNEGKIYRASLLVNMPASSSNAAVSSSASGLTAALGGTKSAPSSASVDGPPTPKISQRRTFSPSVRPTSSRERESSEVTVAPLSSSISVSASSSSSSSSSSRNGLANSTSTETLRSARSHDNAALNVMPGTMMFSPTFPPHTISSTSLPSRPIRQRSASSTDGKAPSFHAHYSTSPGSLEGPGFAAPPSSSPSWSGSVVSVSHIRGRTMSSAFTAKGEVRHVTDLVVGEMVVDTRMYPEGYCVFVRSRRVGSPKKKGLKARKDGTLGASQSQGAAAADVCLEISGKDNGKGREGTEGHVYLKLGALKMPPDLVKGGTSTAAAAASSVISSSASSSSQSRSSSLSSGQSKDKPDTKKGSGDDSTENDDFLPLVYSIYTMPASPLHSSSLNAEGGPTRHLLRVTLPTAQYRVSAVRDPLTGELRSGPKKPSWLRVLEGEEEEEEGEEEEGAEPKAEESSEVPASEGEGKESGEEGEKEQSAKEGEVRKGRVRGIIVDVEIRPAVKASDGDKDGDNKEVDKERKKRKRLRKVKVNGVGVAVVGEKESLTSLGRDELMDDRVGNMSVLSRVPNETESLPEELRLPLAVADDLVDPSVWGSASSSSSACNSGNSVGVNSAFGTSSSTSPSPDGDETIGRSYSKSEKGGEDTPGMPRTSSGSATSASTITSPSGNTSGATSYASAGGIWGLWSSYRFGFGGGNNGVGGADKAGKGEAPRTFPGGIGDDGGAINSGDTTQLKGGENVKAESGGSSEGVHPDKANDCSSPAQGQISTQTRGRGRGGTYPLSTVIIVALIAFLIGSLLRSLLSPADFIYVVTDMREAEEANKVSVAGGGGWREIRRLLEIKYILGGWDFQIAAVRRHLA